MATDGENPNAKHDEEIAKGSAPPKLSDEDAWGTGQNPVRETPTPFKNLNDGGTGAG